MKESIRSLLLVVSIGVFVYQADARQETLEQVAPVAQSSNFGMEYAKNVERQSSTKPNVALKIADEALLYFVKNTDFNSKGRVLNAAAEAHYRLAQYEKAMQSAKEAENIARQYAFDEILATSHVLQGNVLKVVGENIKSIKKYQDAIAFYQTTGADILAASTIADMAETYRLAGYFSTALYYYELAQGINETSKITVGIADTLFAMGQIDEAILGYRSAIRATEQDNDLSGLANAKNNLADLYVSQNDTQRALTLYEEALSIAQSIDLENSQQSSLRGKAEALLYLGQTEEAEKLLLEALAIANERRELNNVLNTQQMLANVYTAQNNWQKAYQSLIALRRVEQEVKGDRESTQFAVMQALFETNVKTAEIASLEKENEVLYLERELEKEKSQYASLIAALLVGLLLVIMIWALYFYREKKRLALLSAELEKARIQAEQATKTKSAFLANMSHEIRTPLTSIIGYSDGILRGDIDAAEEKRVIQIISENGSHLLNVINDILDFTKIESNKLDFEELSTPLFPLLAQIESVTGKRARDKGLGFNVDYQYPLPSYILSDPTRLRQILFNLTNNALKFTEKGEITIRVSSSDNVLKISVIDTGIGISTAQLEKLFTPFKQADGSINRRFGGSGLGLSISQHLAQGLGGHINVESLPDVGSKFTLEIKLKDCIESSWIGSSRDIENVPSNTRRENTKLPQFSCAKVLLADDHPNNRELISLMMRRMQIDVTQVENGLQACEIAEKSHFDLILLDIQMPIMDGIDALKRIKRTDSKTPIIALTANNMTHEIEQYLEAGFDDHLPKPLPREALINKLEQYLVEEDASNSGLVENDEEMTTLIRDYQSQLEHNLKQVEKAFSENNLNELEQLAHSIKGSAGSFGFAPLGMIFDDIEMMLKKQDISSLESAMEKARSIATYYMGAPGTDLALGLSNHNMNIELYQQELKQLSQHYRFTLDTLQEDLEKQRKNAVPSLRKLKRQMDRLALPAAADNCKRLIELINEDAPLEKRLEILNSIVEELEKLHTFYREHAA